MRALLLDDQAKAKVQRVLDYALDPAHFYRPRKDAQVPGANNFFVVQLNTYRCVFTITEDSAGKLWRHLSISVPSIDYSSPAAAFTIAELFGFSGWDGKTVAKLPDGWVARVDAEDHCIALGQEYRPN